MQVVLAGDIIGSQKNQPDDYLKIIEPILKVHSKNGMYQIYRGDSFQIWMDSPEQGLLACLKLKAALRKTGHLDVRIAIGIGDVQVIDNNIAKSTGSALTQSGELLDSLKNKEQNIMVRSGNPLDYYMNTALKIALIYMDDWTENAAAILYEVYKNPTITQQEMGDKLGIKQATASRRLDRAHYKETDALLHLFKQYYKDVSHGSIN